MQDIDLTTQWPHLLVEGRQEVSNLLGALDRGRRFPRNSYVGVVCVTIFDTLKRREMIERRNTVWRRGLRLMVAALLAIALVAAVALAQQSQFSGKVVRVSDGDTITVLYGTRQIRIRLHGIDCPEMGQDFSRRAKQAVSDAVFSKTVTIVDHGTDRYGRTIGEVLTPAGENLNAALVRDGLCWWYERYAPNDHTLRQYEQRAKADRIGLWSQPEPIAPWDWRGGKRPLASPAHGKIIGNRRSKIYHYPGCPSYSAVSERNTVYFDSGTDARSAGYRPAKNCQR